MESNSQVSARKLYAKLRGKKGLCFKVITDSSKLSILDFYNKPDFANAINLDSGRLTEKDEYYKIELEDDLTRESMLGQYIERAESTSDRSLLKSDDYDAVEVLYLIEGDAIFFTKITQSCLLKIRLFCWGANIRRLSKEIVVSISLKE